MLIRHQFSDVNEATTLQGQDPQGHGQVHEAEDCKTEKFVKVQLVKTKSMNKTFAIHVRQAERVVFV